MTDDVMSPPLTVKSVEVQPLLSFPAAILLLSTNKKIHKLDWKDKGYYGVLIDGRLKLHKPDGSTPDWIISYSDIVGEDYIVLEETDA